MPINLLLSPPTACLRASKLALIFSSHHTYLYNHVRILGGGQGLRRRFQLGAVDPDLLKDIYALVVKGNMTTAGEFTGLPNPPSAMPWNG